MIAASDADEAERVVVVLVAAAEEHRELEDVRDRRDRGADHRGDGRHEDVAVADVRDLVGEDAAHLLAREMLQQPLGDGDGRLLGAPAVANAFGCSDGMR